MIVPPLMGWLSWSDAFYRGVIVLVVGSPCAVVASITPAILSSLSNAASKGILIKGGESLERLNQIKVMMFDKTGTITQGLPKVDTIQYVSDINQDNINTLILSIEKQSNHPLAKAIVAYFNAVESIDIITKEEAGMGVYAQHHNQDIHVGRYEGTHPWPFPLIEEASVVNVVIDDRCVAKIYLKDQLRPDVSMIMDKLKTCDITPVLVSGDRESSVKSMASLAHIQHYHAQCLPEEKVAMIEQYTSTLGPVMMVGDGINDAPSLAYASIGVAMGSATDVSLETADVVLTQNALGALIQLKVLAQKMRSIINQNLFFSIMIIVTLLLSNVFGVLQLPQGVVAHEISTILVILNSLRLLKVELTSS